MTEPTIKQLQDALVEADKAGDKDAAQALANQLTVRMQQAPKFDDGRIKAGTAWRAPNMMAQSFVENIAESAGFIPDVPLKIAKQLGADVNPDYFSDSLKLLWKTYADTVNRPINYFVDPGKSEPTNPVERLAQSTGNAAGNAATFMAPFAMVGKMRQATPLLRNMGKLMSTAPGAQIASSMVGQGVTDVTGNPYLGLGASMLAPTGFRMAANLGKKAISPASGALSKRQQELIKAAEDVYKIQLTPGQKTGSRPFQVLENAFLDLPFTGGRQREVIQRGAEQFTKAVLRKGGINNIDDVSDESLDLAFKQISNGYKKWAANTDVNVDWKFFDDIGRTADGYFKDLDANLRPIFKSYIDDLMRMKPALINAAGKSVSVGGNVRPDSAVQINGKEFIRIVSKMRARAWRAGKGGDSELQHALNGLVADLNNMLSRTTSGVARDTKNTLDRAWANLNLIATAAGRGTQNARSNAVLSPNSLTQALRNRQGVVGYARGRGDLNELSRIGDYLGQTIVPSSGTAERARMMNLLSGGTLMTGGGGVGAMTGNPMLGMAAAMLLPKGVQQAYYTDQARKYLTNNLTHAEPWWVGLSPTLQVGANRAAVMEAERRRQEQKKR